MQDQHGTLLNVMCQPWGRMDTCICMAESLHSSPETTSNIVNWLIPQYKIKSSKFGKVK